MSDNQRFSIGFGDGIFWLCLLMYIVLFWGEPDLLDMIILRLGG